MAIPFPAETLNSLAAHARDHAGRFSLPLKNRNWQDQDCACCRSGKFDRFPGSPILRRRRRSSAHQLAGLCPHRELFAKTLSRGGSTHRRDPFRRIGLDVCRTGKRNSSDRTFLFCDCFRRKIRSIHHGLSGKGRSLETHRTRSSALSSLAGCRSITALHHRFGFARSRVPPTRFSRTADFHQRSPVSF